MVFWFMSVNLMLFSSCIKSSPEESCVYAKLTKNLPWYERYHQNSTLIIFFVWMRLNSKDGCTMTTCFLQQNLTQQYNIQLNWNIFMWKFVFIRQDGKSPDLIGRTFTSNIFIVCMSIAFSQIDLFLSSFDFSGKQLFSHFNGSRKWFLLFFYIYCGLSCFLFNFRWVSSNGTEFAVCWKFWFASQFMFSFHSNVLVTNDSFWESMEKSIRCFEFETFEKRKKIERKSW